MHILRRRLVINDAVEAYNGTQDALEKNDPMLAMWRASLGLSSMFFAIAMARACFIAGTPLLTPTGSKAIEDLRVGDEILSRNESDPDAPVTTRRVAHVFRRTAGVVTVLAGGAEVGTTAEHPFWAAGKGWVKANELAVGDRLVGHDGTESVVERVTDDGRFAPVYNVEVEEDHTYFVGGDAWGWSIWSHNASCPHGKRAEARGDKHTYPTDLDSWSDGLPINVADRKEWRLQVLEAKYANYPKHTKAKTISETYKFATPSDSNPRPPAQYFPEHHEYLWRMEKESLMHGYIEKHGGSYHAYIPFDEPVGVNMGKEARWIRAELSGGETHSHPVLAKDVPREALDMFGETR